MANQIPDDALAAIEEAVRRRPGGASASEILRALEPPVRQRTLEYRLRHLVTRRRLIMDGEGRWAKYRTPDVCVGAGAPGPIIPLSDEAEAIRDSVHQVPEARKPVGYDRKFLDRYPPNVLLYLTERERAHLMTVGCHDDRHLSPA